MIDIKDRVVSVDRVDGQCIGRFDAMASPCELIVDSIDKGLAQKLTQCVASEAWRIEQKFSRYRDDNVLYEINNADGKVVEVDEETGHLLTFASTAFHLSDGAFDITSGVLRKVWRFDGGENIPSKIVVNKLRADVGWQKVDWQQPKLKLLPGMELDFGGFGKEYAVDRAANIVQEACDDIAFLVNFGGDLYTNKAPRQKQHWSVGVDRVGGLSSALIQLEYGGLATSGDANRYLLKGGKRYSHVLNPKTGWPVECAPHAVTVAAPSCTDAGLIATLAMLAGKDAEVFLDAQACLHWIQR